MKPQKIGRNIQIAAIEDLNNRVFELERQQEAQGKQIAWGVKMINQYLQNNSVVTFTMKDKPSSYCGCKEPVGITNKGMCLDCGKICDKPLKSLKDTGLRDCLKCDGKGFYDVPGGIYIHYLEDILSMIKEKGGR